jgi:uncharacterized protein YndB with AHSA1/START domain
MTIRWPATFAVTIPDDTPDDTSVVVRREFGAPPAKVWRAMTEPDHMRRWLGDEQLPLTTCEMDVRVGGVYRWVFGDPDSAHSMGVSGTFEEVEPPHRLVTTETFDAFPGPSTNTLELAALGEDRTSMTLTVRYPDQEIRDGWVASGMTQGLGRGYDRLDELLQTADS